MCGPCWALDNLLMDVREVNRKDELVACPAGRLVMPEHSCHIQGCMGTGFLRAKDPEQSRSLGCRKIHIF